MTSSSERIVVVQPLERDQRADQRAGLARLHAGCQQKQQRVEVVLLRHDAVLAQILRAPPAPGCRAPHIRRWRGRSPASAASACSGRSSRSRRETPKAVPGCARRQLPELRVARELHRWRRPPRHLVHAAVARGVRNRTTSGTNGSKNQRRAGSVSFSSNSLPHRADLLAQLDAEPDRVVPQALRRSVPSSSARRHRARRTADRTARSRRAA